MKESLSADAGEESSKVLIDWGGVHGVDVKAVQLFDEIKHHRERGCGNAAGMSWYSSLAMQLSIGRTGNVKKLTIGRPAANLKSNFFFRFGRT